MARKENHQWHRVMRTSQEPGESIRQRENKATLKSAVFGVACIRAGIEPTIRQASKYRRKRGKAYMGN